MFNEMVSGYSALKITKDEEAKNGDVSSNVEQESQLISGPQESSISGSSNTPWKGKLRSSNIVHGSSQTSPINSHVDVESSDKRKVWVKNQETFQLLVMELKWPQKL